jgi:hypothetical protein
MTFPAWLKWRGILLLAAITPPCREITRLASRDREVPIGAIARLRLRVHLGICDGCERYLRQLEVLSTAAVRSPEAGATFGHQARLSGEARERLKKRLRCEPPQTGAM